MSVIFEINRDFSYQAKTLHVHQPAVSVKTVRQCRAQGRLDPKWAAHFVPRGDMRPAPPSCVHHMIRYLAGLYGATVRNTFWGDQLVGADATRPYGPIATPATRGGREATRAMHWPSAN
jgi:hypothetical protein